MKTILLAATLVIATVHAKAERTYKHTGPVAMQITQALQPLNLIVFKTHKKVKAYALARLGCQTPAESDDSAQAFCTAYIPQAYSNTNKDGFVTMTGQQAEPLARLLQIVRSKSSFQDGNIYRSANRVNIFLLGNKFKDQSIVTGEFDY